MKIKIIPDLWLAVLYGYYLKCPCQVLKKKDIFIETMECIRRWLTVAKMTSSFYLAMTQSHTHLELQEAHSSNYSEVPNKCACRFIYFLDFFQPACSYLVLHVYYFLKIFTACTLIWSCTFGFFVIFT